MAAQQERIYGVTNIKSHIPIILDMSEHNYDAWCELLLTHCLSFDVLGHLDGSTIPTNEDDMVWKKRDGIVKLWLYGSVSKEVFKSCFKTGATARDIWTSIETLFRGNKEARAIQLDSELRSKEIGDRSVHVYCQELKSLADLLANVDAPVSDRALVTYMLNGLSEKFDNIINVIKHRQPFPTFTQAREMLMSEEDRLAKIRKPNTTHTDMPSSTTVLTVDSTRNSHHSSSANANYRPNTFRGRGGRRGGSRGRGRGNSPRPWSPPFWPSPYMTWPQQFSSWPNMLPQQQLPQQGILGPRPMAPQQQPQQAFYGDAMPQLTADTAQAFNTMTLIDPSDNQWYLDSGATAHLTSSAGNLHSIFNLGMGKNVVVGNGQKIPIYSAGSKSFSTPTRNLSLNNVLVTPSIIKNLISVRRFTKDNSCSIEFDPFGFSVKDLQTKKTILRSDSTGDLYPLLPSIASSSSQPCALISDHTWHLRLAHPNKSILNTILASNGIRCNKTKDVVCTPCQLAKPIKFPFPLSKSVVKEPFEIVHSDVWTSPTPSVSGMKYYVLFLDHYSHFLWVYPIRHKSDVFSKFVHFASFVKTQFRTTIKSLQCDNGGEYNNRDFHDYFSSNGIIARFSCPHTSQQNGKSERMIRTINNAIRSMLFQAHLPSSFWVEALHSATHILNIIPSTAINNEIPFTKLFKKPPSYDHLRVFGCLCFPNINYDHLSKLQPRSSPSIFLGYPLNHRGYRCMDLKSRKIIISRHVTFDENSFPYESQSSSPSPSNHVDVSETVPTQVRNLLQIPLTPSPPPLQPPIIEPIPHEPPAPPQATNVPSHSMTTRSKRGIYKPKQILSLTAVSKLPTSHIDAMNHPDWQPAMIDEYNAQIENRTWSLVPRPPDANIVRSMWLFNHKFHADGSLRRYKARLVANGKSQEEGVDFNETFSPVVKPATIRTVLHVGIANGWPIHQLDVKNAFLHGKLDETIYMFQPPGFKDKTHPDHVCKLEKSLYGLKQSPRAWNARFVSFITACGFRQCKSDASLFVFKKEELVAYLILYVDDIVLTASTTQLLHQIIAKLKREFPMTDEGSIHHFLGITAKFDHEGLFLHQSKYAESILQRAGMAECKPCSTPVDLSSKLSANDGSPLSNPTEYRSLAGALQYLTFTRPDITYAVQQLCLFMHAPTETHMKALRRVLRFLKGTVSDGLYLRRRQPPTMTVYSDADWAGCPDTRRSTSGFCVFLGDNLISWSSKRQPTVSRSSAEAEYKAVANAVAESCWIRNLLCEMHIPIYKATMVYCDNISAVYLSSNPVQHQRTKHVEIDIHFVREKVALGQVKVLHVPARQQFADVFTKGLTTSLFNDFRSSLGVFTPHATTAGGY